MVLKQRNRLLSLWRRSATDAEALHFLERHRLWGRGTGYVDVHLPAAVALDSGCRM